MQITVHCPQCSKTSTFEHTDQTEINSDQPQVVSKIPMPNVKNISNGLLKLSLAHDDHILLLDVDQRGAVRKTSIVSRVGSERQIAAYIALLTEILTNKNLRNDINLIIHSTNSTWDHILNFVISQFILDNIKKADSDGGYSFEVDYHPKSFYFRSDKISVRKNITPADQTISVKTIHVFDLDSPKSIKSIQNKLKNITISRENTKIGFAITSQLAFSEMKDEVNSIISTLAEKEVNITISDCSSIDKRIISIIDLLNDKEFLKD